MAHRYSQYRPVRSVRARDEWGRFVNPDAPEATDFDFRFEPDDDEDEPDDDDDDDDDDDE